LVAVSFAWTPLPVLLWNASASAPVGLYRVQHARSPRRGDMVVGWAPRAARSLAERRRYLPSNVPLVKRVAAASGDRVCAAGAAILIDGRRSARRRPADAAGRPMPWWRGCSSLGRDEYFLLNDSPASFDGRYFGITRKTELVGRAVLLWAKPAQGSNDG
jgi:conjugative transfer signal peptidase TraF